MLYPVLCEFKKIGLPFHGLTFPDDVSDSLLLNQEWMLWRTAPSGLARPRTGRLQKGPRVKRVATRSIFGGMIAVSHFSCLPLLHSAIASAFLIKAMHAVSYEPKRGPAVTCFVLENGP